jgi:Zn-dependent peptidase ImmA (M78 family)
VFKRGFKSWCERTAVEKRAELGLRQLDKLDPYQLAQHLGITIQRPEEVPGVSAACLKRLLRDDRDAWSAVTLRHGSHSTIILNTAHSAARRASDLMHELAHIILGHTPSRVDVTDDLQLLLRTHDRVQEDEANWLAGCLLLPRPVLVSLQRRRAQPGEAAREYGVSVPMFTYRLQVSGVQIQASRLAAWRASR